MAGSLVRFLDWLVGLRSEREAGLTEEDGSRPVTFPDGGKMEV